MGRKPGKSKETGADFNKRLTELIKKKDISLLALAKETKVPKSSLHDWCTSSVPTDFHAVARLAKFLDVSLSYLLVGEQEQTSNDLETIYERDSVLIDGLAEVRIVRIIPKSGTFKA